MKFEWDENKNRKNILKHSIDFVDAAIMIDQGGVLVNSSPYQDEDRNVAIGKYNNRYLAVVFTMRGDTLRIISARSARKNERILYEIEKQKRTNG